MPGNLTNKPRILHGAFVELGLTLPPLFVAFQFNPEELSRSRSLSFRPPNDTPPSCPARDDDERAREAARREAHQELRDYHQGESDLLAIQENQTVTVSEESLRFDIRLDATDKLNEGDAVAGQFGILPQLSTLELMALPKSESLPGLVGTGYSFTGRWKNPPLVLFIFGRTRVQPVNINSLSVRETEFNTDLAPIRAIVSVDLTVIEGANPAYAFSRAQTVARSRSNRPHVADVAYVVIPA